MFHETPQDFQDAIHSVHCAKSFVAASDVFDWREYGALRSTAEITSHIDHMRRNLVLTLTAAMPALLKERVVVHKQWPKDWWQAVKERWAPRWYCRRFPVEYETFDMDQPLYAAVCPHKELPPNHSSHVQWMYYEQEKLRSNRP